MNPEHIWAAGFWEGDGSVYLNYMTGYPRPRITASENHIGPINRLQAIFGGNVLRVKTPKGKPHYRWRGPENARQIRGFIRSVYPHLTPGLKRERLKLAYHISGLSVGAGAKGKGKLARRVELAEKFHKLR